MMEITSLLMSQLIKQGCDPGYTGSLCVQECKAGYYGQRCEKTCSDHCGGGQRSCHHVNGTCNLGCASGFKGALCIQECTKGYYGEGCTNQCSDHCAGDRTLCHHVTGTCDLGCDSGYQGDLCTLECNVTTWGHNCSEKCSAKCKNNSCNHLTGECNGCVDGYWGRFCDHVRQREVGSHGVVPISVFLGALFVILVIIAVISGFFIWKRRSQRKTEQQNNENDIHLSGMTLGPHIKEATGVFGSRPDATAAVAAEGRNERGVNPRPSRPASLIVSEQSRGREDGEDKRRVADDILEWTRKSFAVTQIIVHNRTRWNQLVHRSSIMQRPYDPGGLRDQ
ncbi:hypothetical protein RRG08_066330 [Elysia crispata]|uniref:Uncharacterized protein n=1 Tax=Elysia crispata TaxID=231223 RepID=A0AAE1B0K0_9GAST|nr:hypothetical protein RRG08_066330 [Elysia crispata]